MTLNRHPCSPSLGARLTKQVQEPEPPEPLWPNGSPYVEPVQLKLPFYDIEEG